MKQNYLFLRQQKIHFAKQVHSQAHVSCTESILSLKYISQRHVGKVLLNAITVLTLGSQLMNGGEPL